MIGVRSASGVELETDFSWSFITGGPLSPALPVALGAAGNFAILAGSGIATVATSAVTGDIGVSPAPESSLTGFSLTVDPSNVFSSSEQITGRAYAADHAPPTPANLTAAVAGMQQAFADAAGRTPDATEFGGGILGDRILGPGVYHWGANVLIPTDVTLAGSASDVWIFQVGGDLVMDDATHVYLADGALPGNVFWLVSGVVELGTTAHCAGVVLTQASVTLRTGASINGRLLAQTTVEIDGSTVVGPSL
jgi:hypothetical protein